MGKQFSVCAVLLDSGITETLNHTRYEGLTLVYFVMFTLLVKWNIKDHNEDHSEWNCLLLWKTEHLPCCNSSQWYHLCHIGHTCLLCNAKVFILPPYLCWLHVILKEPVPYGVWVPQNLYVPMTVHNGLTTTHKPWCSTTVSSLKFIAVYEGWWDMGILYNREFLYTDSNGL